jgi:SET domain-containing protein
MIFEPGEKDEMSSSQLYRVAKMRLAYGLTLGPSAIHGKGCFTVVPFIRGSQIADYAGERISKQEARIRRLRGEGHRICDLDGIWSIDGKVGGNGTNFINHSCDPNCQMCVDAEEITIYALRDILPGEELTIAYLNETEVWELPCLCQAPQCNARRWQRESVILFRA